MLYTIQVSNHPLAGQRVQTQVASESWETLYDGPIASAHEAREAIDKLAAFYKHVRSFRGRGTIGREWYCVYRMGA